MDDPITAIKDHLFRAPRRSVRDRIVALSGCVVLLLALLYTGLPEVLRIMLIGIGTLNSLAGVAELVPADRIRMAGVLRACFYLTVLWTGVVAIVAFGSMVG